MGFFSCLFNSCICHDHGGPVRVYWSRVLFCPDCEKRYGCCGSKSMCSRCGSEKTPIAKKVQFKNVGEPADGFKRFFRVNGVGDWMFDGWHICL